MGLDLVSNVIREYVLCPGQMYRISEISPDLSIIGGPPLDYQIIALNPNVKISCDGCVIEAAKPADEEENGWTMIVTPESSSLPPSFAEFVPTGSGLVGSAVGVVIRGDGGLPVQLRNIEVRGLNNAQNTMRLYGDAQSYELSNVVVKVRCCYC